jgi:hypothetical protein
MSKLIQCDTLDIEKLNIHTPIVDNDKVICELSYDKLNDIVQPFMFFIDTLPLIKFTEEDVILDLRNNDDIKNVFNDIDSKIISEIQSRKLVKTYNLKKFVYHPIVSTFINNNNESFDVLKLKINLLGEYKTSMFYKYGNPIEDLSIMKTGVNVKTIVEFINITFNKDNKTIYIDNCIRQLKVKPIRPQRIKNLEYSFIDSEEEKDDIVNENKNNKDNKNDKDTEVDDTSLDSVSNTLKTLDELNILKDKINSEKDSEVDDNEDEDDENDDSEDNSEDNSGDNNYTSESDTSGENFGEIYDNSDDE